MAIDKIIPRFLVSDKDERLLEEGAMTDALNVSISTSGDGTEGIIKNIKGTKAVNSINQSNAINTSSDHKCIGSVTDSENGAVYWFVWGDNQDHHIVQYRESSDDYRIITKGSWLNFEEDGFVKGNVINVSKPTSLGSINPSPPQRVETFLYFTDNVNQPRKINVTRAIEGEYDDTINANLDFAFNVIKAAPNIPCSFQFVSDSNYGQNKITGNTFQFAMQYIYRDGEESAIGPYSKLAVSLVDIHTKLPRTTSFVTPIMYNVCEIDIPLTQFIYDLKSVRLLARQGGETTFFVVDEFNPYEDKTDQGGTIYDSGTKVYKFKNDRLLTPVDPVLVNKLYDNVPLKALGQSISADRLVYANYEEGRNNHSPNIRGFSFKYHDPENSISSNITGNPANEITGTSPIDIDIDLFNLYSNNVIPAGSSNKISFDFRPEGSVLASTGNFIEAPAVDVDGNPVLMVSDEFILNSTTAPGEPVSIKFFAARSYDLSVTLDRIAIKDYIKSKIVDYTLSVEYNYGTASGYSTYTLTEDGTTDTAFVYGDVKVDFKFDDNIEIDSAGVLTLHPRITGVDFSDAGLTNSYDFGPTFGGSFSNSSDTVPTVIADNEANQQWSSSISNYISNPDIISTSVTYVSSFKAGSNHKFGIVYYDKYNRSGFVNELGTIYNKWYGERNGTTEPYGPSSFTMSFDNNPIEAAPVWADRYQLVCTGPTEIADYVQYTTGGAYPVRFSYAPPTSAESDDDGNHPTSGDPDTEKCQIYLNIDTLNLYRDEKNSLRDYSFTVGDKLRVVSYDRISGYDGTPTPDYYVDSTSYPTANDGSIIEFDVVGVEILNESNENIIHTGQTDSQHHGTFLVLEQPAIASGATYVDGGTIKTLKYDGFDWFSISNYTYRGDGVAQGENYSSNQNFWGNNCVVEIYTPKKRTDQDIYYEIGESVKISTSPPDGITTNAGSVHFRPVACKTPYPEANTAAGVLAFNTDAAEEARSSVWRYLTKRLESNTASDYFSSKAWSAGRAHVVYDKAAQKRIRNGITYSDAYTENSEVLALSSFNPSLANFTSLNHRFGPINYVSNYNDDLIALQQNKVSITPINKNVIQYAQGGGGVTISTDVFNPPQYSSGDFGCDHPESALLVDSDMYFVDASRRKVMRFSGGNLSVISDEGMSSYFEDDFFSQINNGRNKFVSGYNPDDETFLLTALSSNIQVDSLTIGYNASYGKWQSKYTFTPDRYGFVNNLMLSFKQGDEHIYTHDDALYNIVYGDSYDSYVEVVSKMSPSRVKTFKAISYEGSHGSWALAQGATTNLDQTSGLIDATNDATSNGISQFKEREGSYYASMPNDTSPKYHLAGVYQSIPDPLENPRTIQTLVNNNDGSHFMSKFDRLPFLFKDATLWFGEENQSGNMVYTLTSDTEANSKVESFNLENGTITLVGDVTTGQTPGVDLFFSVNTDRDVMRGNFMKIKLTSLGFLSAGLRELYCINTHITDSKFHHPLGQ
jgi:hypothetical protein